MYLRKVHVVMLAALVACPWLFAGVSDAQGVPTGDQLNQLVAPIALYPDALLAQICAASGDPQQIIDADNWLKQNNGLQGQALTDAAQAQGFDPAFISLVSFPSVLDMMAAHVDDYAALGAAFKANQANVMSAIQALRQQAYASGALDSNEYQKVSVEQQNGAPVVVVQPANPQVVYIPQYQPTQVFVAGPSTGDIVAASLISFGAGIAIGALISDSRPWGWSSWGWGWGGGGMIYRHSVWGFNYRYRSVHPYYRPRPPIYNRPIYARPPPNWNQRPGYRPPPPGFRPPGPNRPGYRPPVNGRPPGNGGNVRPPPTNPGGGKPPGNGGNVRPPPTNPGGGKPPGNGGNVRPPSTNPGGSRPPGNGGNVRPPSTNPGGSRPPNYGGNGRPPSHNPYAGYPQGGNRQPAPRPQPTPQSTGARPGAFGGNSNGGAERAASNRGKASAGGGRPGGPHK
jgi:Protein of unknown function (DUF3300)